MKMPRFMMLNDTLEDTGYLIKMNKESQNFGFAQGHAVLC